MWFGNQINRQNAHYNSVEFAANIYNYVFFNGLATTRTGIVLSHSQNCVCQSLPSSKA